MSRPEQHTVVRFSLSSLLAITFGLAIVFAVVGPYIRAMDIEQQYSLLYAALAIGAGIIFSTIREVLRRCKIGQKCGPLLLAIPLQSQRKAKWARWIWLLITLPLVVLFYHEMIFGKISRGNWSYFDLPGMFILPLLYGAIVAKWGLQLWAEGYPKAVEFCENGMVIPFGSAKDVAFHEWNSPALRDIYWGQASQELVININRTITTYEVPAELREQVTSILKAHYSRKEEVQ